LNTFCIYISKRNGKIEFPVKILEPKEVSNTGSGITYTFRKSKVINNTPDLTYILLGDIFSFDKERLLLLHTNTDKYNILRKVKGLGYIISIDNKNGQVQIYHPFFGMLPVYYYQFEDNIIICNNIDIMLQQIAQYGKISVNKKYLLEQYLFNYTILNHSFFNEIRPLPAHTYLLLDEAGLSTHKYFYVEELYVNQPKKWRSSLNQLAESFIKIAESYLPKKESLIAFTGGFDGRTLVAIAIKKLAKFTSFAFGSHSNEDVKIPEKNAKDLDFPFIPLYLDDEKYYNNFYAIARELSIMSGGELSHIYTHFLYSVKNLQYKSDVMLTGYCGSELLRAPHSTGTVISDAAKVFLSNDSVDIWESYLRNKFKKLKFIDHKNFNEDLNELIAELKKYKTERYSGKNFTENQKLYVFLLEETFRQFFGAWVKVQTPFMDVRAPYLDIEFIESLFKTALAGVNNKYYTRNPLNRFKGQLLYAQVIKKTSKQLSGYITGKGYKPKHLTSVLGYFSISFNFLYKRFKRKIVKTDFNNLGILSGVSNNIANYLNVTNPGFYKKDLLYSSLEGFEQLSDESNRDEIVMTLSQLTYLNYLKKRYKV